MVDVCFKICLIIVILRCYDVNAFVIGLFFWGGKCDRDIIVILRYHNSKERHNFLTFAV